MNKSISTWFTKTRDPHYCYELVQAVSIRIDPLSLHDLRFYSQKAELVAQCYRGKLTLMAGYRWDGCTGLPAWLENNNTLMKSLEHDLYYQIVHSTCAGCPHHDGEWSQLTQKHIDAIFIDGIEGWRKPVFRLALKLFGKYFYRKKEKSLIIKKYENNTTS